MSTVPTLFERLAGWLLACGSLALALVPMGGARLCLGHDGHVELTSVAEDACACSEQHAEPAIAEAPAEAPAEEPADATRDTHEPHGPCTDLQVVVPAFVHERDVFAGARPPAFDACALPWLAPGEAAYATRAHAPDVSSPTRPPRSAWQRARREDRRLDQRSRRLGATVLVI
ncbi:MAG: hypothetical protein WD226_01770 [Planctomycetota bacterium]